MKFLALFFVAFYAVCYAVAPRPILNYTATEHVDVRIAKDCLTGDVVLKDCNADVDPPHCRTAVIPYRPNCAIIEVTRR